MHLQFKTSTVHLKEVIVAVIRSMDNNFVLQ